MITVLLGVCVNIFLCSQYKFGINTFSCTLFTGFSQQQGPASLPVMSQTITVNTQVRVADRLAVITTSRFTVTHT